MLDGNPADETSKAARTALGPLIDRLTRDQDGADPEGLKLLAELTLLQTAWNNDAPIAVALVVGGFVTGQQPLEDDQRVRAMEVLVARSDLKITLAAARTVLVDPEHASRELRGRLLAALGELDRPEVADTLLGLHPKLEPDLQARAVELLAQRPAWAGALLGAIEGRSIPREALNVNQLRRIQEIDDPALAERFRQLFGTIREGRNPDREAVVGQMRELLARAPGDPLRGREVFAKLCAQCHVLHGQGQAVGPDITLNGRNDFAQLLSNVFDPNLVIGPGYQATTVATTDGRVLTGLLAEDSPARVVLKIQGGQQEVVPRGEVEELATSDVSLMPEEMEKQLTPEELADLFAYLCLDRPPEDPEARRLPGSPPQKPRGD
jgi:putative heme-binding domain-containing protein